MEGFNEFLAHCENIGMFVQSTLYEDGMKLCFSASSISREVQVLGHF